MHLVGSILPCGPAFHVVWMRNAEKLHRPVPVGHKLYRRRPLSSMRISGAVAV